MSIKQHNAVKADDMSQMVLPDIEEISGVIADYLDAHTPCGRGQIERERIISNCIAPFSGLVRACEEIDACSAPEEKKLFGQFMLDVSRMWLLANRPVVALVCE